MIESIQHSPCVSVIIPIYNVEKYLESTLESVCNQTYQNLQIILVDDGSTDQSGLISDRWKEKDKRIIVIHKENGGVSDARNTGLKNATGEFVYFMDADDTIDSAMLDEIVERMLDDIDMVSFGYRMVEDGRELCEVHFENKNYKFQRENERINFLVRDFFDYRIGWNTWNRIFRKKIIDEYSISFIDTQKIIAEDQLFCLCYLLHCKKISSVDRCYYNYYQRSGSIMGNYRASGKPHFAQKSEMSRYLFQHIADEVQDSKIVAYEPIIHFLLIERVIQEYMIRENYKMKKVKKIIEEDVTSHNINMYWSKQMKSFVQGKNLLGNWFSLLQSQEKIECAKWLLNKPNFFFAFCKAREIREKR